MSVAVLGSGPAALLAALAVRQVAGIVPDIYSQGVKSEMFGAMYLHMPIPLLNDPDKPDHKIAVFKNGTREGYAQKVYGDPNAPVSWDHYKNGYVYGWSLTKTYNILWDYFPHHTQVDLGAHDIPNLCSSYEHILSTVPAPVLCGVGHKFFSKKIWILHGATITGDEALARDHDIMEYNGEDSTAWYRYSQINGYSAYEYTTEPDEEEAGRRPSYTVSKGVKPLRHTCICHLQHENFHRLGRFGKWEKGVLTHHAYRDTLDIFTSHVVQ